MSEIGLTTSETNVATGAASPALSQWRIAAFWLPLAASWLLMTLEGPFVNGTMARLSDPALMIAAFGITLSLSITIESPVIMLLATATALARDRQSYLKIRRFTIDLMVLTTALTALIGWTPLYDIVVRQAMGIPTAIADAALPGLRIMLLWSAAIAWRRFKQGVMIRHNATRLVGYGTIVRLVGSAGTAAALGLWGKLPGVWLGACALMVGVIAEAVFAHFAAAPVVARVTSSAVRMGEVELTYNALVRYHAPLAATTLLLLLGQPIVGAALARTAQPELALAAWPVTYGLVLIFRSPGAALPEAVIALLGGKDTVRPVRRFGLMVGLISSGLLAILAFTPLANFYLTRLIGITPDLARIVAPGVQLSLLIPWLMAVQGWQRGRLMNRKVTAPITVAMGLNLATMAGVLALGVALRFPGVPLAGIALTAAMGVESLVLFFRARGSS
ncbi:MAG: hypothetical protein HY260_12670 [Chloroflexi bacterium]|nr:hypothetical protein [Chloroflexota bacterium]